MESAEAALNRLCDPSFEVSAHYLIARDGRVFQLVADEMRAWHAGAGTWCGTTDINSHSIGIELDNDGACPFAASLMNALEALMIQLMDAWDIPARNVIGHSDMAPGRKSDPGGRFDWARLERGGLAVGSMLAGETIDPAAFDAALDRIGYPQAEAEIRLDAFRMRHNQGAVGPLTGADCARAIDLASRAS